MTSLIWIGIAVCISQSAMFSGLNLAVFTVSKLRLEIEARGGNRHARRVLLLREDSNFLLTTILWGNVGANVLLAQLSNSVLAGVLAFLFSTVLITFAGEILPQAYFSRNALRMASLLSPVLRAYQIILYALAKPTAVILDKVLGPEAMAYMTEHDLRELITVHAEAREADIDRVEGRGALNFLAIDDLRIADEGEPIDPRSVVTLSFQGEMPIFPSIERSCDDEFLLSIEQSQRKWVIVVDRSGEPQLVINADSFLRDALLGTGTFDPLTHCHRPIIVRQAQTKLGEIIPHLRVHPVRSGDDVIDQDIILVWDDARRVVTGSDILGRLLRGIVTNVGVAFEKRVPRTE